MDSNDGNVLRKWISVGDILVLVSALLATGLMTGELKNEVRQLRDDVSEIKAIQQGPTPGAAQLLAGIQAKDAAQDSEIAQLRQELKESRREILDAVNTLGTDLRRHMEYNQPPRVR